MEIHENASQHNSFVKEGDPENKETHSIPVIHENVVIGKKIIETGKVRIVKTVNEENQFINIPLIHEELNIKTIPINQYVDAAPEAVRYEGDTMIIPVLKEVSVVRLMLVEEIHVTKKRVQTQDSQTVSLRKEQVTIENVEPGDNPDQSNQDL